MSKSARTSKPATPAKVRRAAIEALEGRQLLSVAVPAGYVEVGSVNVSATSGSGADTPALEAGQTYLLKATGTHQLATTPATRLADAGSYEKTPGNWVAGTHLHVGSVSWGSGHDSSSEYGAFYTPGSDGPAHAYISDSFYADNAGSLTLTVYRELPHVSLQVDDPDASEDGPDDGSFTVARTGSTSEPLDVHLRVGGTAQAGVEYDALYGQAGVSSDGGDGLVVRIPAGSSSRTIDVMPFQDAVEEDTETVDVQLLADAAYQGNADGELVGYEGSASSVLGMGSVLIADATTGFSIKAGDVRPNGSVLTGEEATVDYTVRLGNSFQPAAGVANQTYTVTAPQDATIVSVVAPGFPAATIAAGGTSATLVKAGGNGAGTFAVEVKVRFAQTGDKTVNLAGAITIADGGDPKTDSADNTVKVAAVAVQFDKAEVRPGKGAGRAESVTVKVKLGAAAAADKTIALSLTDGQAASLSDNSITVPAGQTEASKVVTVTGNNVSQQDRANQLQGKDGNQVLAQIPVTVTAPKKVQSSAEGAGLTDRNNSAAIQDAAGWHVKYVVNTNMTVLDQFGKILGPAWAGAKLWEKAGGAQQNPWSGFVVGAQGTALDNGATAVDPVQSITGLLRQQDAQAVAAGTANFGPVRLRVVQIVCRVTDGNDEYLLDGTNFRQISIRDDIITSQDSIK